MRRVLRCPLYQLLQETLKRIASEEDCCPGCTILRDPRRSTWWGFRPELTRCVGCRAEIIRAEDQFFDAGMGGVLCPDCGLKTNTSRPVFMEALKFLRHLQRSS